MTALGAIETPGCGCDDRDLSGRLIGMDAALSCIAAHATPAGRIEAVPLDRAYGRILARPVRSVAPVPGFDSAAMDGYAVITDALTGVGPWELPVVARVQAGQGATVPLSGAVAARIFTGAPVPPGADAVVKQEDVERNGETMRLDSRPAAGLNIRLAGSDMDADATVMGSGHRLGPRATAACAAAGAGLVRVRDRPRVALLVTGDELRQPGGTLGAAQIRDVNTPMLAAALGAEGAVIVEAAHGADNREELAQQLRALAVRADLVVTTGGISVGEEDHVKPAVSASGGEILFSGVAIKPGKPVSFGRIGTAFWLGLPGNPLSAFVTWQVFGTVLLRALSGETGAAPARRHVVTAAAIRRKTGRCELRPAMLTGFDGHGRDIVRCDGAILSDRVSHLPHADGLIFLPADTGHLPARALVEFLPFTQS
ncbi:molybdopterin molybdotransferase MoeA [Meridianimarinicoccus sp. RP-17]|uniref:molybdopterin molybdotransferase MoeA n=1 Tax=Meridianimarinicoccus zhengii TaxID=2056810 RepID=UPI000DACD679|nr:gephyrin-like molybdotransferase Glp [Phycocomes zhengii]